MKTTALFTILTVVLLSGCAATVNKSSRPDAPPLRVAAESSKAVTINITGSKVATASNDWEQLKGEWRSAMKAATAAAGIQYSEQDGNPRPTGQPGTLVVVDVNDYRYLSPGARYGFGVMTGNAYVDSKVRFMDLKSGASYGERVYNTSSSAWQGIFSAMTAKQIEAICKEIVTEITARP
ncbi:MAG TPA: hypothetical protein VM937_01090 [Burkholderiaceae bacterium]|jgi:hypothetical protein|nr:hypothetical protein [Burkholderiaceae bacterium]